MNTTDSFKVRVFLLEQENDLSGPIESQNDDDFSLFLSFCFFRSLKMSDMVSDSIFWSLHESGTARRLMIWLIALESPRERTESLVESSQR